MEERPGQPIQTSAPKRWVAETFGTAPWSQQRLATTAILLVAIRDLLTDYKKQKQADHIDETYLRGYDLDAEDFLERIVLNPDDQPLYDNLLARTPLVVDDASSIAACYPTCMEYLQGLAPVESDYRKLIDNTSQLDDSVQVLVAVASDLPEAYVIFETLNERGADLTTADLLKNYLFARRSKTSPSFKPLGRKSARTSSGLLTL